MTPHDRKQLFKGLGFLSPWLIGFTLFLLVPIILSFYYSLCEYTALQSPQFIGLANYSELFHDPVFWKTLRNILLYAAMALPASMMVSLGLALLLNVQIPGQPIFRTILFLPSLVPLTASAMIWLWIYNPLGLLNRCWDMLGISHLLVLLNTLINTLGLSHLMGKINTSHPSWLADTRWAMPALALMSVWSVGYTVIIFLAGLQDVPRELYEAAEIDGATGPRRLWHVTLPMLSPVIFFNLIMAIIGTFQVFAVPFIMTTGGPDRATYFPTMFVYDNAFSYLRMGYASAMAWIELLMILALTAFAFWTSRRWVHYQGK